MWGAIVSLMSSLSARTGIGYQALSVDPGRILQDEKVITLASRYMAPGGDVFEIEHVVSVNYRYRKVTEG